jgi:hypothetical protein
LRFNNLKSFYFGKNSRLESLKNTAKINVASPGLLDETKQIMVMRLI